MDNPRGRIALLRGVATGRIEPSGAFVQHFDRCLGCLACEVACPSGVQYGRLLEVTRAIALKARPPVAAGRFIRWLAMRHLLPHAGRLCLLARLAAIYEVSGLRRLVHRLNLLPPALRVAEALLPSQSSNHRSRGRASSAPRPWRGRVALFTGCVQEAFLGHVNQATVRVLERNGFEVMVPAGQTCCGALQLHMGERELAIELARRNVDAFLEADADAIVVNAGGCGAALQNYPELLRDDPDYAGRAQTFRARLYDVSVFLAEKGAPPPRNRLAVRVTYADSCHLRNAQGVICQPRDLLRSIPGLEYIELSHPDACCGGAGVYNILHPATADCLLDAKLADIVATGADVVVTTNPGCQLQIMAGVRRAGLGVRVLHLVELLDEAYAAERMEAAC